MQALIAMEQLTIGQLQIYYAKVEKRKKQNREAFSRWKERNPELYAERKRVYNRIWYERKKAAKQAADTTENHVTAAPPQQ